MIQPKIILVFLKNRKKRNRYDDFDVYYQLRQRGIPTLGKKKITFRIIRLDLLHFSYNIDVAEILKTISSDCCKFVVQNSLREYIARYI